MEKKSIREWHENFIWTLDSGSGFSPLMFNMLVLSLSVSVRISAVYVVSALFLSVCVFLSAVVGLLGKKHFVAFCCIDFFLCSDFYSRKLRKILKNEEIHPFL